MHRDKYQILNSSSLLVFKINPRYRVSYKYRPNSLQGPFMRMNRKKNIYRAQQIERRVNVRMCVRLERQRSIPTTLPWLKLPPERTPSSFLTKGIDSAGAYFPLSMPSSITTELIARSIKTGYFIFSRPAYSSLSKLTPINPLESYSYYR